MQRTYLCFKSQHEQLFTLTLAYKLGLEHDVICSDIQCESICKCGSKITLFWSWLSLCAKYVQAFKICANFMHLCQSNKKCVSCITYTDGCCANCVKSLGKLLKVLK